MVDSVTDKKSQFNKTNNQTSKAEFTKAMKKTHTIYMPDMLGYHNAFLRAAFAHAGYRLKIMKEDKGLVNYSLPYISGDYCLPAMMILGQMFATIESGKVDTEKIAFLEPQTGGACRAGNYYNSMIKSLERAGYGHIPVISLNVYGQEKHPGFSITPALIRGAVAAVCYGDLLMTLLQQVRPYENEPGTTQKCYDMWERRIVKDIRTGKNLSKQGRRKRYQEIVASFARIKRQPEANIDGKTAKSKKTRVGITGEIYIKFSRIGNDNLEKFLQDQGCDYRMGGFVNYVIYLVNSERENQCLKGTSPAILAVLDKLCNYLEKLQLDINDAISKDGFLPDASFSKLQKLAEPIITKGCNIGDGWLIAGEVADLVEQGYDHILIVHPFGCLVSHVCERGIMKKLHNAYPNVNIQTIEYDYDTSKTLRESRLMLALSDVVAEKSKC